MKLFVVFILTIFISSSEQFENVVKILAETPRISGSEISRIVNGFTATNNQFPHQALLYIRTFQGTYQCGGSLISEKWVLSAAHCIIGATAAVARFGSVNRNSMPVERSAVQINRLNSYNPNTLLDDISLIKLNASVPNQANVRTIQLPKLSQNSETYFGTILTVSGFGLTTSNQVSTNLQYTKVIGISNAECRSIFGSIITARVLCTRGYPNRNAGSCQGDSGGPLITSNSTLVGIVSFGSAQSCTNGLPQGFTRVAPYLSWISSVTGLALN